MTMCNVFIKKIFVQYLWIHRFYPHLPACQAKLDMIYTSFLLLHINPPKQSSTTTTSNNNHCLCTQFWGWRIPAALSGDPSSLLSGPSVLLLVGTLSTWILWDSLHGKFVFLQVKAKAFWKSSLNLRRSILLPSPQQSKSQMQPRF